MLESIKIRNFQAQRDLILEFSPEITTIVGETDVGKSSTLRALVWALINQCNKNVTTWGQEETEVWVVIGQNEIKRIKNKKQNIYSLNGTDFAALRQDVPPEIKDVINISQDSLQSQFSPTFWFTLTGGELAKKLNEIVNLEIVDFVFADLASQQTEAKNKLTVYQERLQQKEASLKKLEKLPELQEKLQAVNSLEAKVSENVVATSKLAGLIEQSNILTGEVQTLDDIVAKSNLHIVEAESVFDSRRDIAKLEKLCKSYQGKSSEKTCDIPEDLLTAINKGFADKKEKQKDIDNLAALIRKMDACQTKIILVDQSYASAKKKLDEAMKGRCPLCGRGSDQKDECCIKLNLNGDCK